MESFTGKITLKSILWDLAVLLSVAGLVLTVYLMWVHVNGSIGAICTQDAGCKKVLTSSYSEFLGLPTAFYGFSFYLTVLLLFILYPLITKDARSYVLNALLSLTLFGFLISAFLTIYSIQTLNATCPYCLTSFGIITALLLGLIFWWIRGARMQEFTVGQNALWQGLAVFFLVATLIVGGLYFRQVQQADTPSLTGDREQTFLASGPHSVGNPSAPIRVVEFFDLACPYCRKFTLQTFPKIQKNYIQTGKVLWTFRAFPISNHPHSTYAFSALHSVPDDRYLETKKTIMRDQKKWKAQSVDSPVPYFEGLFRSAGFSPDAISRGIGERLVEKRNVYLRKGIRGTPTFVVNGKLVQPKGYREWKRVLDRILESNRARTNP
ncbi:MAG: thioredoxin domain-containing protein [bacterium]